MPLVHVYLDNMNDTLQTTKTIPEWQRYRHGEHLFFQYELSHRNSTIIHNHHLVWNTDPKESFFQLAWRVAQCSTKMITNFFKKWFQ